MQPCLNSNYPLLKYLLIQTAFIGDVVLATPVVEKLRAHYPQASIDFLVRKGNESLLENHPHIRKIIVLDKKKNKYPNLLKLVRHIRAERYDHVINMQRFFTTGLITVLSGAKETVGFDKNPLSRFFSKRIVHVVEFREEKIKGKSEDKNVERKDVDKIGVARSIHETERNLSLIEHLTDSSYVLPKLYPTEADFLKVARKDQYICIAPASVWFTKQFPVEEWVSLIRKIPKDYTILLLGSQQDIPLCHQIVESTGSNKIEVLAGQLSFLESAALMKHAKMNYVNDSAPLHFASAMNAPVTAVYCSTVPEFGFGPLSDNSNIGQINYELYCRPCGLHGYRACPEGHFKCSEIDTGRLAGFLEKVE